LVAKELTFITYIPPNKNSTHAVRDFKKIKKRIVTKK